MVVGIGFGAPGGIGQGLGQPVVGLVASWATAQQGGFFLFLLVFCLFVFSFLLHIFLFCFTLVFDIL